MFLQPYLTKLHYATIPPNLYHIKILQQVNMAEEKFDFDEEEDLNDGYKHIKKGSELLPSSRQGDKQGGSNDYKLGGLVTIKQNQKNIDIIQKCIGQITISYEGDDTYRYG
eukprot:308727_1